jgi:phosphohistidine phosphatase
MQRKIYLVRHAQAIAGSAQIPDELRPLTQEGETSSTLVGTFLKQKNSNLNLIISSNALRARHTALAIGRALSNTIPVQVEKVLYSENKLEILKLLSVLPDSVAAVMLVGHYPTIVELHNYLASNKQLTSMHTGQLVALTFDSSWALLSAGVAAHEYTYHPSYLT